MEIRYNTHTSVKAVTTCIWSFSDGGKSFGVYFHKWWEISYNIQMVFSIDFFWVGIFFHFPKIILSQIPLGKKSIKIIFLSLRPPKNRPCCLPYELRVLKAFSFHVLNIVVSFQVRHKLNYFLICQFFWILVVSF